MAFINDQTKIELKKIFWLFKINYLLFRSETKNTGFY